VPAYTPLPDGERAPDGESDRRLAVDRDRFERSAAVVGDAPDDAALPTAAVPVPAALGELGGTAAGRTWLRELPRLVDEARTRWGLRLGAPFTAGRTAWTAPARTRRGEDAVVKVVLPHVEAAGEADALELWAGGAAAELFDHDGWTLLLRRCRPGHAIEEDPRLREERVEVRLEAAASVLARLQVDPPSNRPDTIRDLGAVTPDLAARLRERTQRHGADLKADAGLLAEAADLLDHLPGGATRATLLHGDLNPGNLLADDDGAARRWVAIDPKPLVGDPAYDPWPLLAQTADPFREPSPASELRTRTRLVCAVAGLDRDRVAAWALARTCESAFWRAAELGDRAGALAELEQARVWSRLAG
jgi:streptomycin 6-kinase